MSRPRATGLELSMALRDRRPKALVPVQRRRSGKALRKRSRPVPIDCIKAASWGVAGPLSAPGRDLPAGLGLDLVSMLFQIGFTWVFAASSGLGATGEGRKNQLETKSKLNRNPIGRKVPTRSH